jgi:hypothetical protein
VASLAACYLGGCGTGSKNGEYKIDHIIGYKSSLKTDPEKQEELLK